jgi:hypothetical protein
VAYLPPTAPFPGLPGSAAPPAPGKPAPVFFATGGEKGVVRLWRSDTGRCVYEQPAAAAAAAAAAGGIMELELLPGAAGLLAATQDCRLLFHRPADGGLAVARQLVGNQDEITDLRLLRLQPSGGGAQSGGGSAGGGGGGEGDQPPTHVAVASNSDQVRVFDAASMSCVATLSGHSGAVLALDALPLPGGAALLASAGKDASLRLWSLPAGRCVAVGAGHVSAVGCVAFARRGGGFVATGGTDKLLKVRGRRVGGWVGGGAELGGGFQQESVSWQQQHRTAAWLRTAAAHHSCHLDVHCRLLDACVLHEVLTAPHPPTTPPSQPPPTSLLKVWDTKGLSPDAEQPAKLRVSAAVAAHDKDINAVAVAPNDSGGCMQNSNRLF